MNKIFVAINLYNDCEALKVTVPIYAKQIDGAIVVDGRYVNFPNKEPYSTDGGIEYLQSMFKEVYVIKMADVREIVKRTAYFQYADKNLDWKNIWLIRLDADEAIKFDEYELKMLKYGKYDNHKILGINMVGWDATSWRMEEKVMCWIGFHNTPNLSYQMNHFTVVDTTTADITGVTSYSKVSLDKTWIDHMFRSRPTERQEQQRDYYHSRKFQY